MRSPVRIIVAAARRREKIRSPGLATVRPSTKFAQPLNDDAVHGVSTEGSLAK
jgi:hypothetical protein